MKSSGSGDSPQESNRRPTLRIYVARHCLTSPEAVRLADEVRRRFSEIFIEVVDLDGDKVDSSDRVWAVPAYVLNGQVLFVGNPTEEGLFGRLTRWLAGDRNASATS